MVEVKEIYIYKSEEVLNCAINTGVRRKLYLTEDKLRAIVFIAYLRCLYRSGYMLFDDKPCFEEIAFFPKIEVIMDEQMLKKEEIPWIKPPISDIEWVIDEFGHKSDKELLELIKDERLKEKGNIYKLEELLEYKDCLEKFKL